MQNTYEAIAEYSQNSGENPLFLEAALVRVNAALVKREIVHHAKRYTIFRLIDAESKIDSKNTQGQRDLMAWLVQNCGVPAKPRGGGWVKDDHEEPKDSCFSMINEMVSVGKNRLSINDIARLTEVSNPTIASIHVGMVWDGIGKTKERIKELHNYWTVSPQSVVKARASAKAASKKTQVDRDLIAILKAQSGNPQIIQMQQRVKNRQMAAALGIKI